MTKEATMPRKSDRKFGKEESQAAETTMAPPEMPRKTGTDELPYSVPFMEMGEFNENFFEAYVRTSQAILESAAALNQEMVRFAGERYQADLEAIQTLPGYTNVQGVVNFQSEFMRKTAEAYQTEFSKLMQQSADAASTVFEPMIETASGPVKGGINK
jgi:hypothetical protein